MLVGGIVLFPSPRSAGFRGRNSLALKVTSGVVGECGGAFSYTIVFGPFLSLAEYAAS